jgi:glycosyltransferase involved in cell wall biosynthesis
VRILYLNPNGSMGGAERVLCDLMQAVRRRRPDWNLDLITGSDGGFVAAARASGINAGVLPFPASFNRIGDAAAGGPAGDEISIPIALVRLFATVPQLAAYVLKLRALINDGQPDVIHSNGFKTHVLTAWAAPRKTGLIWHVHDYVGARPLMRRLIGLHARRCDSAIANSNSVARDLDSVCGGKLKIHTVYNAVDLKRFSPCGPALELDSLCGLPPAPEGTIRVGLVATMARWKGHEVFLRALSMLPRDPAVRGYVIGGPIYATRGSQYSLDELRSLASAFGLNGRAGFTGYVKDAAAAIRALDIVVHVSTQPEPFGLALAEAMACGKPVIASMGGGVTEIIADKENALSHPPGNATAMAGCIGRLADPVLRETMGRHGRRWAKERFAPCRLAHEMAPIYESLARGAR